MNPKKTSWLLIPIVLIIWGRLFFQWDEMRKPRYSSQPDSLLTATLAYDRQKYEELQLSLNYRDPFLGETPTPSPNIQPKAVSPSSLPQPVLILHYLGGVRRPADSRLTGLVSWSGRIQSIEMGQKLGSWEVSQLSLDLLTLKQGKHSKTYYTHTKYHRP